MNFGGFVPLSTVDWRGRSVCTVFLRGCSLQCSYCQNEAIQTGEDYRDADEIMGMIEGSLKFISAVVFSGGEPTLQKDALIELSARAKALNLDVGIQTNGFFPETLKALIGKRLVDKVALDYKTRWEGFSKRYEGFCNINKDNYLKSVRRSISACGQAWKDGTLQEFEIVVTVFPGNEKDVRDISEETRNLPLVLQQGEHKIGRTGAGEASLTNGTYMARKKSLRETHPPLSCDDLMHLADGLGRPVRIRTRTLGEISYEGHRSRRVARKR